MMKKIKAQAQAMYPIENRAECYTAFLQGTKKVVDILMKLPLNEALLKIIELNKEMNKNEINVLPTSQNMRKGTNSC